MKEFTITPNESGQRLDKLLKKILPEASAGFLYKMLRKKNITHNGKKADGREMLNEGDRIQLFFSDATFLKFSGNVKELEEEYEVLKSLFMQGLKVVYEDEDILAADKPANMLSQKAKASDISANERLLGYLIRSGALQPEGVQTFRPSVCNRLDRNTTGLILMGKTLRGSQFLSESLRNRSIQKYYRAVVAGHVQKEAHMSGYLLKDEEKNKVQILKEEREGAAFAETVYCPVAYGDGCTLLELQLITGKTHQIRAQLAADGHPVIGDRKYGDAKMNKFMHEELHVNHQLLHAYRIVLPDGREICAEPPEVFERVMKTGIKY
ncbi:MAG: RluA family pseudouridine synthase [Muribaculaceae bacterium]|nr:RluA family pseudouridine synthase [Roseburia sp.]MCM1430381.1 RluA family pseudouridine synthase [Muribaculaceae bacterium]MCM1492423.1 RluA family pseudouridine synthase [Muribaculaceae bacterium]